MNTWMPLVSILKDVFFKRILHNGDSSLKLSKLEGVKDIVVFRNSLQYFSRNGIPLKGYL